MRAVEGIQPPGPTAALRTRAATINLWLSLALLGLTAAVYAPVRHHAFLNYDDNDYVTENPHVTAGLHRDSIVWAWTAPHSATWHPLTTLSHLLDCQLFGLNPGPPHVVNAVLHALNTLVLFWVFTRMTAAPWRSACVAGLFAVHPIHIESVAWVAERKDVLSSLFWMLTLWTYVDYVRRRSGRGYALLLASYTAALLSKPMVVTLPFVLLLLDVWPLARVRGFAAARARNGQPARATKKKGAKVQVEPRALEPLNPRALLIEKLPLLALAGIASAITIITQRQAGAVVSLYRSAFADRAANALVSYVAYLGKMLWPSRLAPLYPFEAPLPLWQVLGSSVTLIALTAIALRWRRRYPYLLVGWLWYVGTLVPVIGLVQYGSHAMADRYTYLPSIGVFIIAVWGFSDLLRGWEYRQVAGAAAGGAALAACAVVTVRQLRHWQDSLSLFQHTLAVTQNNAVAELHLGAALVAQGRRDEGMRHIAAGERIHRETEERHYARVLGGNPEAADAHVKLARLLADGGDTAAAATHYREAIRLNPALAAAHNNLAVILESTGQMDEAIAEYREGIRLEPQRAESRSNLAAALANAGHPSAAIEQFRAALDLKPELADARFGLASAYVQAGQVRNAVAELNRVLRERPDWPAVEATLAWLLATADDATIRDAAHAVELAQDAARRTAGRDADVLNSLAAAYAEAGRFPEAIEAAAKAIEIAHATQRTALIDGLTQHLARYRAGQPVREPVPEPRQ